MLAVNEKKSGSIPGVGADKFKVAIDGGTLEEVSGQAAKEMAVKTANANGFGNAGMCDAPAIGVVDAATDDFADGIKALDPKVAKKGFRAEFTFAKRI